MSINKFITNLDLARQAEIMSGETAVFQGGIELGIPFSGFPSGVDTSTIVSLGIVNSEFAAFSGNTGTTVFNVTDPSSPYYSVSATTLSASPYTIIDGGSITETVSATTYPTIMTFTALSGDCCSTPISVSFTPPIIQELYDRGLYDGLFNGLGQASIGTTYIDESFYNVGSVFSGANLNMEIVEYGVHGTTPAWVTGTTSGTVIEYSALTQYWTDPIYESLTSGLTLPITPESADTQTSDYVWTLTDSTIIDENFVGLQYTGYSVTYSFDNVIIDPESPSITGGVTGATSADTYYLGTVTATLENFSAGTLDYKGTTNWLIVNGSATIDERLTTDRMTINNPGTGTPINNLGITSDGDVVFGTTGATVTGLTFNDFTYDLTIGLDNGSNFTDNLGILASDIKVTGGTYDGGTGEITFVNNSGGSFVVSGLTTEFTGNTSGNCITDLHITNLHSCSPLYINPLDEGNVYFGSTSGVTIDVANNRIGIGTETPSEILDVNGNTKISGTLTIGTLGTGTSVNNLGIDASGNIVTGTTGSSVTTYWSAGTGTNAVVLNDSGSDASGILSLAQGSGTTASGDYSHAEGSNTTASGIATHSEGLFSNASGDYSHAEGFNTDATGIASHAEGQSSQASGNYSHAEGLQTDATNTGAHSEGTYTLATGIASHAEGRYTIASGNYTHAGGYGNDTTDRVIASGDTSFAHQRVNNTSGYLGVYGNYSTILGGQDNNIDSSSTDSSILGGNSNRVVGANRSTVLGGQNITATTSDTVYTPNLEVTGTLTAQATLDVEGDLIYKNPIVSENNSAGAISVTMTEATYPSNTVITIDPSTASNTVSYTLPAVTSGLRYTFVGKANANATGVTVTFSGPSAVVGGVISCSDGNKVISGPGSSSITNVVFSAGDFKEHTKIEFICDGTNWIISGHSLTGTASISTS